jgi:peroxiredoxin
MNGEDGATELPMPATFALDRNGVIQLAYVDEDYTRRLDPEVVLDKLQQLRRS